MKCNKYLYGEDTPMAIPEEVINNRLTILRRRLNVVMSQDYMNRDYSLKNDLVRAIKFWENINNEN